MNTPAATDRSAAKQTAAMRNQAAMRAMAAGDMVGAEAALLMAVGMVPNYLPAWLNLAAVRRQRNDFNAAFEAVRQALIVLWEASDRICGKRLKALLPLLLPALERNGHLQLDPAIRALLTPSPIWRCQT